MNQFLTPEILYAAADDLDDDKQDFMCSAVHRVTGSGVRKEFEDLLREHGVCLKGNCLSDLGSEFLPKNACRFMFLEFLALEMEGRAYD